MSLFTMVIFKTLYELQWGSLTFIEILKTINLQIQKSLFFVRIT